MNLEPEDLSKLCEYAVNAALKAGEMIAGYRNGKGKGKIDTSLKLEISKKDNYKSEASQALTEADLKSQEIVLEALNPTLKDYDLALLSEESTDDNSRHEKDYFWCIDPIDGTLAFIENEMGFSVSIGLVDKNGIPQIGVIFDPAKSNLFYAIKDKGAYKNNTEWKPAEDSKASATFNLMCDRSLLKHDLYNEFLSVFTDKIKDIGYSDLEVICQGGACMNAIDSIERAPACYFKIPKNKSGSGGSLWDFAATACIFNELKRPVTNMEGNRLDLNRTDSTFMGHQGVLFASNDSIAEAIKTSYREILTAGNTG